MQRTIFLSGLTASVISASAGAAEPLPAGILNARPPGREPFAAEERAAHARLGVCAVRLRDDRQIVRRGHERFPLASTFKLPLVMDVLSRVDGGIERLDRTITFGASDILPNSPVTGRQPRGGRLTVAELCGAAIQQSDNTAANLLLATLGGPPGVTSFLRGIGDPVTRLDRNEPSLNRASPGDVRDTTTPLAMANVLTRLVREPVLSARSKGTLFGWMRGAVTGGARIRAGVPAGWTVGDKTGTTNTGGNDIAILWPQRGEPIVLAVYAAEVQGSDAARDAAIASVARSVVRELGG
jgi:beta-lactamase class A